MYDIKIIWKIFREKLKNCRINTAIWRNVFDLARKKKKAEELEKEMAEPNFWQDKQKAAEATKELNAAKEELKELEDLEIELVLLKEGGSEKDILDLGKRLKQKELQIFLSGKYDRGNAILSIFPGAGGQDSQDWTTMLLRMYQRYCERKGFKTEILSQSFGEAGGPDGRIGTKQVSLEIKGNFAYGFFKKENGVHRLVRISPFSAQKLRHTSFAIVEVLPEIKKEDEKEIEVKPEDLKIDFYNASGPGGQYVNKRQTAVRITHSPTGIVVTCQSERLQGENRKRAMSVLFSKLFSLRQESREKELSKIKGGKISASWGNQIRSYVLHPYKMVKDLRTDIETSGAEAVLDGDLDQFIEAELKIR